MSDSSKITKDPEEIRQWAEERGGKPAHVADTGSEEDVGILRIEFPGYSSEVSLEPIPWEQWFEKFAERNLAFLYQLQTAAGELSNFNKIISDETAAEAEEEDSPAPVKKAASTKRSATKSAPAKKAVKKAAAKKAIAKKAVAKKAIATKTVAKKAVAKKAVKKAAPVKAAKKGGAQKSDKENGSSQAAGEEDSGEKSSKEITR